MTSTTTTATETVEMVGLPSTQEEWADLWRQEFTWGTVNADEVAQWAMANSHFLTPGTTLPSEEAIIDSFHAANPRYNRGGSGISADSRRILDWISGIRTTAGGAKPTAKPLTGEGLVEALLPIVEGRDALEVYLGMTHEGRRGYVRETLAYQFGNWMRGVYTVSTVSRAYDQFIRRCNREFSWAPSSAATERLLKHVMKQAREYIAGERTDFEPPPLSHDRIEAFLEREIPDYFSASRSNGRYYTAAHMSSILDKQRREGEFEFPEDYTNTLREYLQGCFSWSGDREAWDAEITKAIDAVAPWIKPGSGGIAVEVDENLNDGETLLAWQMSLHPKASEFQANAIKNGVQDFVDYARFPGFKEGASLTANLRRMVGQYGFMKYTGKERRSVIEAALKQVVEAIKDQPISDEEWKARWKRRDLAVSYVSGRYGEQNSMCKVLEQATGELGIDPVRKPRHKVRFEGSGVIAEVPVETWYDDENTLRTSASRIWEDMSEEDKRAAIVETVKPYVNWSDMKLLR